MGGDWGRENEVNSHRYRAEVQLSRAGLNEHGFIIDIFDLRHHLEQVVSHFDEKLLNELPELEGQNPSLENLCRVFLEKFRNGINLAGVESMTVRIREDKVAWASLTSKP